VSQSRVIEAVYEFFELVGRWSSSRAADESREVFVSLPNFDEGALDPGEVATRLAHAANRTRLGVSVDHNEGFLIQELAIAMIEYRVGRPQEFWSQPDLYTDFVCGDVSVEDGLRAFDRWLATENLDLRGTPLRLLNIFTGYDFYLAYLCPEAAVDNAITCLETLGLRASLFEL